MFNNLKTFLEGNEKRTGSTANKKLKKKLQEAVKETENAMRKAFSKITVNQSTSKK